MDNTHLHPEKYPEDLQTQIAQARQRAAIAKITEPHAKSAYYDRESG